MKFVKTETKVEGKHLSSKQSRVSRGRTSVRCGVTMSSGGQFHTPKKRYTSSASFNTSSCRLCGSVKDATHCKNLFAKANHALLAAAEDIFNSLLCHELLPHLLCRSCERRLKNYVAFKTLIARVKDHLRTLKE